MGAAEPAYSANSDTKHRTREQIFDATGSGQPSRFARFDSLDPRLFRLCVFDLVQESLCVSHCSIERPAMPRMVWVVCAFVLRVLCCLCGECVCGLRRTGGAGLPLPSSLSAVSHRTPRVKRLEFDAHRRLVPVGTRQPFDSTQPCWTFEHTQHKNHKHYINQNRSIE